jgi:hypothetical protein
MEDNNIISMNEIINEIDSSIKILRLEKLLQEK